MNKLDYRMDYEERKSYVYDAALSILENDDDAFLSACNALDFWNGFMNDSKCFPMWELDELLGEKKPSEVLNEYKEFLMEYFYYSINGLESTNDIVDVYRNEHTDEEVLDELIDNSCVDIYGADSLLELIEILWNEDFGIEEDWEYDEDNYDGEEYLCSLADRFLSI